MLVLRVENYDQLANGGPLEFMFDRERSSVGRKSGMDWVLPDPSRAISGHHFDVRNTGGCWYLEDVSTNGTYLYGQRHRLTEALLLTDGMRLQVGHYVLL
jgi:predicted component of type VI protein secretion system